MTKLRYKFGISLPEFLMASSMHRGNKTHVSTVRGNEQNIIEEDILKAQLYGCPVFRVGYIFNFIKGMDKNMAEKIAQHIKIQYKYIKSDILNSHRLGLFDTSCGTKKPFLEDREGRIIVFPEFDSHLANGHKIKIRISITICSPPHHSKIWVRISSADENQAVASVNYLETFFGESERISAKLIKLFKSYYQKSLEINQFPISLKKLYEVRIETASADLGKTSELLVKPKFFMYDIFKKEVSDELIGFFGEYLGKRYQTLKN